MRARTTWTETTEEPPAPTKCLPLEVSEVDEFLGRLDRMAHVIQSNQEKWGMDFTAAKNLVNAIDKLADDLETATYGAQSLANRKQSLLGRTGVAEVSLSTNVHSLPESGADDPARLAKANLCVALARWTLGRDPTPEDIEDQAFALMYVPDDELLAMQRRAGRNRPRNRPGDAPA